MSKLKFSADEVTFRTAPVDPKAPWTAALFIGVRATRRYNRWLKKAKPHELLDEMLMWNGNNVTSFSNGFLVFASDR